MDSRLVISQTKQSAIRKIIRDIVSVSELQVASKDVYKLCEKHIEEFLTTEQYKANKDLVSTILSTTVQKSLKQLQNAKKEKKEKMSTCGKMMQNVPEAERARMEREIEDGFRQYAITMPTIRDKYLTLNEMSGMYEFKKEHLYDADELSLSAEKRASFTLCVKETGCGCIVYKHLKSKKFIAWLWKNVVCGMPYSEEWQMKLRENGLPEGRVLDINNDEDMEKIVEIITGPLSNDLVDYITERFTLHRQFGASCCGPSYNGASDDANIRAMVLEHLGTQLAMRELFGCDVVAAQQERMSALLPKQGDQELCHVDTCAAEMQTDGAITALQGKVNATEGSLRVFIGSNNWAKLQRDATRVRNTWHIIGSDKTNYNKELFPELHVPAMCTAIKLPANSLACFTAKTIHEHGKNNTRYIKMAHYCGFMRAQDVTPEHRAMNMKSYLEGNPPPRHPPRVTSGQVRPGGRIHVVPKNWFNFTKHMNAFILKINPKLRAELVYEREKQGTVLQVDPMTGENNYKLYGINPYWELTTKLYPWTPFPYSQRGLVFANLQAPPESGIGAASSASSSAPSASHSSEAAGAVGLMKSGAAETVIVISDDEDL